MSISPLIFSIQLTQLKPKPQENMSNEVRKAMRKLLHVRCGWSSFLVVAARGQKRQSLRLNWDSGVLKGVGESKLV